jgi:hypothetical protein
MAETYTPTPTNVSDYTAVEDGDDLDAASVRAFLESLADYSAFLRITLTHPAENETITGAWTFDNNILLGAIDIAYTTPQTLTRACDAVGVSTDTPPVIVAGVLNNLLSPGTSAYFNAPKIPDGAEITGFGVRIDPNNDTLPTNKARIQLLHVAKSSGTTTVLSSLTDPLTGAAYQAEHDLEQTGVSFNVGGFDAYIVCVLGENGGDEDAIEITSAPWVTYKVTYPLTG